MGKISSYPLVDVLQLKDQDRFLIDDSRGTKTVSYETLKNNIVSEFNNYVHDEDIGVSDLDVLDGFADGEQSVHVFKSDSKYKYTLTPESMYPILLSSGGNSKIRLSMRKNTWRGKNLGNSISLTQRNGIIEGTFDGLFLGDYWEIPYNDITMKFRIMDFDYWYHRGSPVCNNHHIVIMPDEYGSDTYCGAGDIMRSDGIYYNDTEIHNKCTDLANFFADKIGMDSLSYGSLEVNSLNEYGRPNGVAWKTVVGTLPNAIMIIGNCDYYKVVSTNQGVENSTESYQQLSGLKMNPKLIIGTPKGTTDGYWTRDLFTTKTYNTWGYDSTSWGALRNKLLSLAPIKKDGPYGSNYCLRPVFGICG